MAVRLTIELERSIDGRLDGSVVPASGGRAVAFSGILELLKVLEELGPRRAPDPGGGGPAPPQPASA